MGRMDEDPIGVFADGSQLLVSTQKSEDGTFTFGLYLANLGNGDRWKLEVVSGHFESATCLEAQQSTYRQAQCLYPDMANEMKKPPYLIWAGPLSDNPT